MQRVRVQGARFLARLLRTLWGRLRRELRYRREIEHLNRLDEAALADLGLRRGGIEGAVRGRFDPHAARPPSLPGRVDD